MGRVRGSDVVSVLGCVLVGLLGAAALGGLGEWVELTAAAAMGLTAGLVCVVVRRTGGTWTRTAVLACGVTGLEGLVIGAAGADADDAILLAAVGAGLLGVLLGGVGTALVRVLTDRER